MCLKCSLVCEFAFCFSLCVYIHISRAFDSKNKNKYAMTATDFIFCSRQYTQKTQLLSTLNTYELEFRFVSIFFSKSFLNLFFSSSSVL